MNKLSSAWRHILAIAVFAIITLVYFSPVLQGKRLKQSDIIQHIGMSKEIVDFRNKTGQEPLWTNSMFGGMPAYQISTVYPSNLLSYVDRVFLLGLPHPINNVFLCLMGFYFLMVVLGVDFILAIAGAILFAFSSYFFIFLEAGHNSQAHAISYMAPVLAGIILTYRGRLLAGGAVTALFLGMEIFSNHIQITYYLFLTSVVLVLVELYKAIREKTIPAFVKSSAVLFVAAILALGPNITSLWTTYEYTQYSTRGKSDLAGKSATGGLEKSYALDWSFGVAETFTTLIPNFVGGASQEDLGTSSNTYKAFQQNGVSIQQAKQYVKGMPTYWGPQPFTSGPAYFGSIAILLFVLGIFVVRNELKWWLILATCMSLILCWGKNIGFVTDFIFNYLPGYNKFRAVSFGIFIAQLTVPILGLIGLNQFIQSKEKVADKKKILLKSFYIVGGLLLFFVILAGGLFDFNGSGDKNYGFPDWLLQSLKDDRESMLRSDAIRSLFFIGVTVALLWYYLKDKIQKNHLAIAIAVLCLVDLWMVDKRYLNNDKFVNKTQMAVPFEPTQADTEIMQDPDPDYRVLNLAVNTFNDASTSYFHKSIGGYHAAKPKRYQELIENQISKNNIAVLSMLNTKYIITPPAQKAEGAQPSVQQNPQACGHAWFVKNFKIVANADSELNNLTNFEPSNTAIIDQRFEKELSGFKISPDSVSKITLDSYQPNHLTYTSNSAHDGLVVFSEVYYDKGWNAYVDGVKHPYFRTDYVLRGMIIPSGSHKVEFKFEPQSYIIGEKISLAASSILLALVALSIFLEFRKRQRAA